MDKGGCSMIQEITVNDKDVLVMLSGSIYVEEAAQIRESLIGYIDSGHKTFIVDLGNVDYIDSSGLGVLVTLHKMTQEKNGSLTLIGVQGMVKELLQRTRLDKVLHLEG